MTEDYRAGYVAGLEAAAKLFCLNCKNGIERQRRYGSLFSYPFPWHNVAPDVRPEDQITFEACRASALWDLVEAGT